MIIPRHPLQQEPATNSSSSPGYEYFYQVLDTGLLRADGSHGRECSRATSRRRNSPSWATSRLPARPRARSTPRNLALYPGGIIPASAIDPNMQALMKLYPTPNSDPNATGGYNWTDDLTLQSEQPPMDDARGLQHQRQHQAVCPLQPAAGSSSGSRFSCGPTRPPSSFPTRLRSSARTAPTP